MPLKLHPTGLGSGIDKDRPDYAVQGTVSEELGCVEGVGEAGGRALLFKSDH
jgi:hypothetical protein